MRLCSTEELAALVLILRLIVVSALMVTQVGSEELAALARNAPQDLLGDEPPCCLLTVPERSGAVLPGSPIVDRRPNRIESRWLRRPELGDRSKHQQQLRQWRDQV